MKKLTKSQFRMFLDCPREFWLSVHEPEFLKTEIPSDVLFRIRQGYEVESYAKEMLNSRGDANYVYQKRVETAKLSARFDVFSDGAAGASIFEIKSSKSKDPENVKDSKKADMNLYDLAFQVYAAEEAGISVARACLIKLNGEYRLGDSLDLDEFFVVEDWTEKVKSMQAELAVLIDDALALLTSEPERSLVNLCGNKLKCPYFEYLGLEFPRRTIFDIPRLSAAKLEELNGMGILDLQYVPKDFKLTDNQRSFVDFETAGIVIIDRQAIADELRKLEYPLYFLDYETVNPSIPQFKGMAPLQHITFQYSLHVKETPESELEHFEFLSDGSGFPSLELAQNLRSSIGETGSVIVWYKPFEMGRNSEMAELFPEFAEFFESVNSRVFDLMEIFKKQLYRDPAFLGSSSIKKVLPVVVPNLSYDGMEIENGGAALSRWFDEVYTGRGGEQKDLTMLALREYCKLDTLAMVRILENLQVLIR